MFILYDSRDISIGNLKFQSTLKIPNAQNLTIGKEVGSSKFISLKMFTTVYEKHS